MESPPPVSHSSSLTFLLTSSMMRSISESCASPPTRCFLRMRLRSFLHARKVIRSCRNFSKRSLCTRCDMLIASFRNPTRSSPARSAPPPLPLSLRSPATPPPSAAVLGRRGGGRGGGDEEEEEASDVLPTVDMRSFDSAHPGATTATRIRMGGHGHIHRWNAIFVWFFMRLIDDKYIRTDSSHPSPIAAKPMYKPSFSFIIAPITTPPPPNRDHICPNPRIPSSPSALWRK